MDRIELPFKDARVRSIVCAAFPGAKTRRTIKLTAKSYYHVSDFWDGGSRNYCCFVRLSDLSVLSSESVPKNNRQVIANPYALPIYDINLEAGFVVVEHTIFCGKDIGYRIYFHPCLQLNADETRRLLTPKELPLLTEGDEE